MSLLSVDDIVRAVYSVLTSADEWDNTVWLYTSDHGVNMGQFRIPCVKRQVYESNTRIPSFIKAPGVAAGAARIGFWGTSGRVGSVGWPVAEESLREGKLAGKSLRVASRPAILLRALARPHRSQASSSRTSAAE